VNAHLVALTHAMRHLDSALDIVWADTSDFDCICGHLQMKRTRLTVSNICRHPLI